MTEQNKYWRNKVTNLKASSFEELAEKVTEFSKDKFVVATQVFHEYVGDERKLAIEALVYWKQQDK